MKPKPSTAFEVERIPSAMRDAPRWVCWRPEIRDGKWTKVPVDARTLNRARSNDPTTWSTLDDAVRAATADHGLGIGFMLGDEWLGVDLDGVVDPSTGKITEPEVEAWLASTESYVETTPSKTGLHVIFKGVEIPAWSQNRRGFVEVYAEKRFFTVTGEARFVDRDALPDQAAVDGLCNRWLRADAPTPRTPEHAREKVDHSAEDWKLAARYAEQGQPREVAETALRRKMELEGRGEKANRHDYIPRTVERAYRETPSRRETSKPLFLPPWRGFPLDDLPECLRGFVSEHARTKGVDPSLVALPLLAACAGFIGNTFAVSPRSDYREPLALWFALASPSGSKKSPAMKAAMKHFRDLQNEHYRQAKEANAGKSTEDRTPIVRRFVDDSTPEALFGLLESNPRGLLAHRDELAEMLAGFGRFKSGKQAGLGEASQACKLYDASPHGVDRRSSGHAYIPLPLVSIVGAIPPKTFRTLFAEDFKANGLFARFVPVWPPSRPARWTDEEPDWRHDARIAKLARTLDGIPLGESQNGTPEPEKLDVLGEARTEWTGEHDRYAQLAHDLGDGLAASATSKTAGLALRVAGVFHIVEACDRGEEIPQAIGAETMRRALSFVRWLHEERLRVFARLEVDHDGERLANIAEGIQWSKHPHGVTPKEVFEARKGTFRDAEDAELWLRKAAARGLLGERWGTRGDPARGGRETWIFTRSDPSASETAGDADEAKGFEVSSHSLGDADEEA
jgi:hypothetical protein